MIGTTRAACNGVLQNAPVPTEPEPASPSSAVAVPDDAPRSASRLRTTLLGKARDLHDQRIFHTISLIPFLAWVGLGADGLSSSAYGPEEAFKTLGTHKYLAVGLAALMAFTVLVISSAYKRIIEAFPHGGGGYVVATKLLGRSAGVVSGCALLVDYVLTITVSVAAAGDVIFSFLPLGWAGAKLGVELFFILSLTTLNLRGVRESALALAPIFLTFVITHALVIVGGLLARAPEIPGAARDVASGFHGGLQTLGAGGMLLLFVHAYSLGGGTYTGIEAVLNGLPIMREPRVKTARSMASALPCTDFSTRSPDTGSLRDRITTSTRFTPSALNPSSFFTRRNAIPGLARCSRRASCSWMYGPSSSGSKSAFSSSKSNSARELIATTS